MLGKSGENKIDETNTPRLKIEDDIIASEMNEQQKKRA